MPVVLQEMLAKPEEMGMGNGIVVEENGFIRLVEDPTRSADRPCPATHVDIREIRTHIARPRHVFDDRAGTLASLIIQRTRRPRAICEDEKPLRANRGDRIEYLLGVSRPIEDPKSHRRVVLGIKHALGRSSVRLFGTQILGARQEE
jgi:hypothetical protein